jgi:HK97 family phage major capsid protein
MESANIKPDIQKLQQMKRDRKAAYDKAMAFSKELDEKKDATAESRNKLDAMIAEMETLSSRIEADERMLAMSDVLEDHEDRHKEENPEDPKVRYANAFRSFLRYGAAEMDPEERKILAGGRVEQRALGVASGAVGGYLLPEDFYNQVVDIMKAYGGMRASGATIITTTGGNDMPIPISDDTSNVGEIVAEGSATNSTTDPTFSQGILKSYLFSSKILRVGVALLQDEAINLEGMIAKWLGTRIARITNTYFTTGDDDAKPEGFLTNCGDSGVTAAAATAITFENLIDLMHSVDPAYQANGMFMLNDATLAIAKKMKTTTEGIPLWLPGVALREPSTILGKNYIVNQDMPAYTSGLKAIAFGDFSNFFIRDVRGATMMRLVERYADYLQVGFLMFSRHDSLLTVTNSIKYMDVT